MKTPKHTHTKKRPLPLLTHTSTQTPHTLTSRLILRAPDMYAPKLQIGDGISPH